tara:strand:+ start:1375 stop:1626 length:252 start_codon:yes stop_codon:yes gene_type:complete
MFNFNHGGWLVVGFIAVVLALVAGLPRLIGHDVQVTRDRICAAACSPNVSQRLDVPGQDKLFCMCWDGTGWQVAVEKKEEKKR